MISVTPQELFSKAQAIIAEAKTEWRHIRSQSDGVLVAPIQYP